MEIENYSLGDTRHFGGQKIPFESIPIEKKQPEIYTGSLEKGN